jgi:hypothetical protein
LSDFKDHGATPVLAAVIAKLRQNAVIGAALEAVPSHDSKATTDGQHTVK